MAWNVSAGSWTSMVLHLLGSMPHYLRAVQETWTAARCPLGALPPYPLPAIKDGKWGCNRLWGSQVRALCLSLLLRDSSLPSIPAALS